MTTTPQPTTPDDVAAARHDVARRLEALARLVRTSTAEKVEAYDAAYATAVKAAHEIRQLIK